ncbi:hypothetical protein Holit_03265 [Hollandina sp. SP2]
MVCALMNTVLPLLPSTIVPDRLVSSSLPHDASHYDHTLSSGFNSGEYPNSCCYISCVNTFVKISKSKEREGL